MELYTAPRNRFVAGFIGSPTMNFANGEVAARFGAHSISIRPEHLAISPTEGDWRGTVGVAEHLGSDTFLYVHLADGRGTFTVRAGGEYGAGHGDTVYLTPDPAKIHRFDAAGLRIE